GSAARTRLDLGPPRDPRPARAPARAPARDGFSLRGRRALVSRAERRLARVHLRASVLRVPVRPDRADRGRQAGSGGPGVAAIVTAQTPPPAARRSRPFGPRAPMP